MAPHADFGKPGKAPEYDPEIKDMADFIHNYNINSDLAVRNTKARRLFHAY
ncbi:MAG: hypothetical protein H5T33_07960 [Candidatus Methanosuratus sp.]|nr:hypothetical protein [Candidatus Methanosuratincola sp.]